jgi:outer membrane biosynthesis protein TonB
MPVKVVPVCEPMSTVAKAAVEDMTGAKSAAVKSRTAAMEAAASAVKSATTVVATAMTAAMAAMATSDFGRQPVGSVFRRRRGWIDRRKRFRALAGRGRQHQHRGSRKTETTDKAAPGIWNLHHA